MGYLTLVLGGARSGKSRFAQELAAEAAGRVVYLATLEPNDGEMRRRVDAHRASRPSAWTTLEEPLALVEALSRQPAFDVCLLDCLTLWVSNLILRSTDETGPEHQSMAGSAASGESAAAVSALEADVTRDVLARVRGLVDWQSAAPSSLIVVSNEVGSGIVPDNPLGRLYRDILGEANQLVAAASDRTYLCVAGYAIDIKTNGRPIRPGHRRA